MASFIICILHVMTTIRAIKSSEIWWARHKARILQKWTQYFYFDGWKGINHLRPFGSGRGQVKLTGIMYKCADWIHLPLQRVQWRVLLNTTKNVQTTWKAGDVFISRTFISLSSMKIIMAYEQPLLCLLFCKNISSSITVRYGCTSITLALTRGLRLLDIDT